MHQNQFTPPEKKSHAKINFTPVNPQSIPICQMLVDVCRVHVRHPCIFIGGIRAIGFHPRERPRWHSVTRGVYRNGGRKPRRWFPRCAASRSTFFCPGINDKVYVSTSRDGIFRFDYDPTSANPLTNGVIAVPTSITTANSVVSGSDGPHQWFFGTCVSPGFRWSYLCLSRPFSRF